MCRGFRMSISLQNLDGLGEYGVPIYHSIEDRGFRLMRYDVMP
jgi:hypothetical protein